MTLFRAFGGKTAFFCMSLACAGFGAISPARAAAPKVVPLWPDQSEPAPAGQAGPGEVVDERGKDGKHDRAISNVTEPTLTVYLPEKPNPARPAIVICPGGGYRVLAIDKEGYPIAERLNQAGVAAIVLKYRLPAGKPPAAEGETPLPIQDVQRAIRLTRAHAVEWNIDASRVGVMGFSAGGHVASTAATQFDSGDESAAYDHVARQSSRPDFAVLMYAVVSMREAPAHKGSRRNLLGENPSPKQIDRFSGELHVTKDTPPLFIVHAKDDKGVVVENSTQLAAAAKQAGVPHELVLFETGGHGFGLGPPGSECSAWPEKFLAWMRGQKFLTAN